MERIHQALERDLRRYEGAWDNADIRAQIVESIRTSALSNLRTLAVEGRLTYSSNTRTYTSPVQVVSTDMENNSLIMDISTSFTPFAIANPHSVVRIDDSVI